MCLNLTLKNTQKYRDKDGRYGGVIVTEAKLPVRPFPPSKKNVNEYVKHYLNGWRFITPADDGRVLLTRSRMKALNISTKNIDEELIAGFASNSKKKDSFVPLFDVTKENIADSLLLEEERIKIFNYDDLRNGYYKLDDQTKKYFQFISKTRETRVLKHWDKKTLRFLDSYMTDDDISPVNKRMIQIADLYINDKIISIDTIFENLDKNDREKISLLLPILC